MATISIPAAVPSAAEDAEQLRKAFQGWGTNESLAISVLAHRDAAQRHAIRRAYAEAYGEELLRKLDHEINGDLEKLVLLWTPEPAERDAVLAEEALRRWKPAHGRVIVEIACARGSAQLLAAKREYQALFKRSLEEDVATHTSGDFRKLLFPLVSVFRYEGPEVNMKLAQSEAKLLHERVVAKAYGDEDLIRIFTTRSKTQLFAMLNHYIDEFGHPITEDLKSDGEDEFLKTVRALIDCTLSAETYFAEVLRLAIAGNGTDENALTRVVATRAEVDMKLIKDAYHKRNSVPLEKAIKKDTRGHYEEMLLALIGQEDA